MGWVLIFCTHVSYGSVCLPPQPMPDRETCFQIGNTLVAGAKATASNTNEQPYTKPFSRCIQTRQIGKPAL